MSLSPAIHPAIRGVEGKAHPVDPRCAAPGCISVSQQRHHMWPKSSLQKQPQEWVSLPSGRVVSNGIGLCMRHHALITGPVGGHQASIKMEPDETFVWLDAEPDPSYGTEVKWINQGLLHPQPYSETPVDLEPKRAVKSASHSHPDLAPGETCHSCGYQRPLPRPPGPARKVKSYGIAVPDDAEIGADVLDEWVEQLAVILGFGSDVSQRLVRYHTIVAALAWTMQNRQQFIEDIMEVKAS